VSVVGLLQIVFALGLDLLIDGSNLHPIALAGIALVLAPTAWMMLGRTEKTSPLPHAAEQTTVSAKVSSAPQLQ
jgi:drug/metabolite transporter (DMT)-like permease